MDTRNTHTIVDPYNLVGPLDQLVSSFQPFIMTTLAVFDDIKNATIQAVLHEPGHGFLSDAFATSQADAKVETFSLPRKKKVNIPKRISGNGIYVEVDTVRELERDLDLRHEAEATRKAIEATFEPLCCATKAKARYNLKVSVSRVSDGTLSGTFLLGKERLLGKALVGVNWEITRKGVVCGGGEIMLMKRMTYAETLNPFGSPGEDFLIKYLAPRCAYRVASEIGLQPPKSDVFVKRPQF